MPNNSLDASPDASGFPMYRDRLVRRRLNEHAPPRQLKRSAHSSEAMTQLIRLTLILITLLVTGGPSYAKAWHGLVPLTSTRADVVSILNQCGDQNEACRFTFENEDVHILFSGGLHDQYRECTTRIAPETILFIEVEPRAHLNFSALHLDKKNFKMFNPSAPSTSDSIGYFSKEGVVIRTFKNLVQQVYYIPKQTESSPCRAYYEHPESFVEVPIVHVPMVFQVDGPASISAGERPWFSAHSNLNERRGFKWTLSAGRIISGQFTQQIEVDTTGLSGKTIVITAEIGSRFEPPVSASREVKILPY